MKKNVLLAATMAAMLASCSSDDLSLQSSNQEAAQDGQYALAFDALTQRSISTRAGLGGAVMDDDRLKKSVEEGGGFGVFAYQTENNMEYTDGLNAEMRMWNEKVTYDNGSWSYDHVQYWPNEFGSDAQSDDIKRVSFFAYAPFVDAATTGKVDDISGGITGFTSNTTKGDPYVKYVASFDPAKSVDLCWGVCGEADKSWKIIQGNAVQDMTAGLPWLDVQRPAKAIGQKVKFTFQHALAQLNVQIDADPDIEEHDDESKIADGTKVYVRSITFSGFAQKGSLNLNNTDSCVAKWEAYNCCSEELKSESVTLYDGRKDANPGVAGAVASGEKLQSLNPTIISNDGNTTEGVTEKPKNLFNSTNENAPVYVIPTDDEITVTITYGIETVDDHLAGYLSDKQTHGRWKDYTITKQVKFGEATKLENGKKYTLNIHLALNSVKFDGAVSDWDDSAEAGDAWLPANGGAAAYPGVTLSEATQGMVIASNGRAYRTAEEATIGGTTPKAWIAYKNGSDGLAIALNPDANYGDDLSLMIPSADPAEDAITGGKWVWPSKRDVELIISGLSTNADGCPLEDNTNYWTTDYVPGSISSGQFAYYALGYAGTNSSISQVSTRSWSFGAHARSIFAFGNLAKRPVALSNAVQGMFVAGDLAYESLEVAAAFGVNARAWIAYKSEIANQSLAIYLNDFYGEDHSRSWSSVFPEPVSPIIIIPIGPVPVGKTEWPTKAQFDLMLPALKALPKSNEILEDGSAIWCEDEYDDANGYYLYFSGSDSYVGYKDKNDEDAHNHFRKVFIF